MVTSFLVFFEYLNNKDVNQETDGMLRIISSFTNLSEKQLEVVINYTNRDLKVETIKTAISRANKLYTNHLLVVGEDSESYLSTQGFNAEYLGISNTKRANFINDIYIKYLYKCTIDNSILDLKIIT